MISEKSAHLLTKFPLLFLARTLWWKIDDINMLSLKGYLLAKMIVLRLRDWVVKVGWKAAPMLLPKKRNQACQHDEEALLKSRLFILHTIYTLTQMFTKKCAHARTYLRYFRWSWSQRRAGTLPLSEKSHCWPFSLRVQQTETSCEHWPNRKSASPELKLAIYSIYLLFNRKRPFVEVNHNQYTPYDPREINERNAQ